MSVSTDGSIVNTPGVIGIIGALARTPSARVATGLAVAVLLPIVFSLGVLKPTFDYLFPENPVAVIVRRVLQLALIGTALYVGVRFMRPGDSRTGNSALIRMLVGGAAILLLPTVILNRLLTPLISHFLPGVQLSKATAEVVMIPVVLALYIMLFRLYEQREIRELSRPGCLRDLGLGFLCGISITSATFLLLFAIGNYSVVSVNPVSVLVFAAISMAFVSLHEELFFRGVIYRICEGELGTHFAVVLSAAVFGVAHLANQNLNLAGLVSATLGGALLGILYTYAGRLWIPIAFHFGWNFSQIFFGSNVSGVAEYGSFLESRLDGPTVLTGGAFGIETSMPLLICLLALTVLTYRKIVREGRVVRPFWYDATPT